MKKNILIPITLVFFSLTIKAQAYYGFKVGANFANFTGDVENNTIKPSFHVGGVVEILINDLFSVQPELIFSMQGYQDKDDSNIKFNYYYVNAPIMLKYFINDTFTADAGPQVGYLTYAKSGTGNEELTDLIDSTNEIDFGFNLGGSYEMDNGMNVSVRYYLGLANVFDDDQSSDSAKNSVFQISLGYKFY
jgi:hypothetical protein